MSELDTIADTEIAETARVMLDLVRDLRDVATEALCHRFMGLCPDLCDGAERRDPGCPACAVLMRADALLRGAAS